MTITRMCDTFTPAYLLRFNQVGVVSPDDNPTPHPPISNSRRSSKPCINQAERLDIGGYRVMDGVYCGEGKAADFSAHYR